MTRKVLVATFVAALTSVGCANLFNQTPSTTTTSTTPSATGVAALSGTWSSISSTTTAQNTCDDFQWTVTNADPTTNTATGAFIATCLGNMAVGGTASGVLSGTSINWTATAIGTSPTMANCPISLSGTAVLDNSTQIRMPFTGTSCQGSISGSEILHKS